jgi:putative YphP/YqiW family bacilliredoxin
MYPEQLVAPMRTDLTSAGFAELKSSEEVDSYLKDKKGTTLLVINSFVVVPPAQLVRV